MNARSFDGLTSVLAARLRRAGGAPAPPVWVFILCCVHPFVLPTHVHAYLCAGKHGAGRAGRGGEGRRGLCRDFAESAACTLMHVRLFGPPCLCPVLAWLDLGRLSGPFSARFSRPDEKCCTFVRYSLLVPHSLPTCCCRRWTDGTNTSSLHPRGVSQSKIPLGLVIQAMALDIDQKDGGLEVVNFGAQVRRWRPCRWRWPWRRRRGFCRVWVWVHQVL